jgi:3'-phosphoadenosine 5'-phosphosulfate (PAPS) 3'-phosphatase
MMSVLSGVHEWKTGTLGCTLGGTIGARTGDTGAGHCIAQCAGAKVRQIDSNTLAYNQKESLLNPFFVVTHPKLGWEF